MIFVATNNLAKFEEIKDIMSRYGVTAQMPGMEIDVNEGTVSYEDNARKKALYLTSTLGSDAMGEDSGIEVPALGGFPGVISARFVQGADRNRNAALLDRMKQLAPAERKAVFKAYAVIALADGTCLAGYGELTGKIIEKPAGENGFGYDPIFVPDGYDKTLAQMSPEEKNNISHRRKAIEAVIEKYTAYLKISPPSMGGE